MILDHLLQVEVSKNEAVNALLESVELAGKEVDSLENWLYKHNTKLGVMTHALQTITQENKSLGQQRKNHDRIQNTLQVGLENPFHAECDIYDYHQSGDTSDFRRFGRSIPDGRSSSLL